MLIPHCPPRGEFETDGVGSVHQDGEVESQSLSHLQPQRTKDVTGPGPGPAAQIVSAASLGHAGLTVADLFQTPCDPSP